MPSAVCVHTLGASAPTLCNAPRQRPSKSSGVTSRAPCWEVVPTGVHLKPTLGSSFLGSQARFRSQSTGKAARASPSIIIALAGHEKPRDKDLAQAVGNGEHEDRTSGNLWGRMQHHVVVPLLATGVAVSLLAGAVPSATAADALKTCQCLLQNCGAQLAECLENPGCAANVACLNTCNGRPDETECQIKCGDLFQNSVVDNFNKCAVSEKGCVPQKQDEGIYPEPKPEVLVPAFDTSKFTGEWFITSGQNPIFDVFDCQLHTFEAPAPKQVVGNLTWRINTPDGGFFTRSAVQKFKQDEQRPGILYNHGNEFLHYEDDWYIVSSKIENGPDDYVFVYYRGRNDAWTGYGGAVVYTRSRTLPENIVPELREAAQKVGLDYSKFKTTDNTCGPQQPLFYRLAMQAKMGLDNLFQSLQNEEKEVERFFEDEEALLLRTLDQDEKELLSRLNMSASEVEQLFKGGLPSRAQK